MSPFCLAPGGNLGLSYDTIKVFVQQRLGEAIIHKGLLFVCHVLRFFSNFPFLVGNTNHWSNAINSGERVNLIMWFKRKDRFENFLKFPVDILHHILAFIDITDTVAFSMCSKQVR
jgi:hypothetical protein